MRGNCYLIRSIQMDKNFLDNYRLLARHNYWINQRLLAA